MDTVVPFSSMIYDPKSFPKYYQSVINSIKPSDAQKLIDNIPFNYYYAIKRDVQILAFYEKYCDFNRELNSADLSEPAAIISLANSYNDLKSLITYYDYRELDNNFDTNERFIAMAAKDSYDMAYLSQLRVKDMPENLTTVKKKSVIADNILSFVNLGRYSLEAMDVVMDDETLTSNTELDGEEPYDIEAEPTMSEMLDVSDQ